jgi:maleate isomerase
MPVQLAGLRKSWGKVGSYDIDCLPTPLARVALINTAVNRVCESQFHEYAPRGLSISNTRARVAGRWSKPLTELANDIRLVTSYAAECAPDLLVYNCTASSMKEGTKGETEILRLMAEASDIPAVSTSSVVAEACAAMKIKTVVLISPYPDNRDIINYLGEVGVRVVHDVALGLLGIEFGDVTPAEWCNLAIEHDRPNADAIFLSCTATTQLEAVAAIEASLRKPVINSNQAVIWGSIRRLRSKLGNVEPLPRLGKLLNVP